MGCRGAEVQILSWTKNPRETSLKGLVFYACFLYGELME
nr:MAG TPA: hypothetical protein [Caudoviricetes sp.]